jgi:hypothetical protein
MGFLEVDLRVMIAVSEDIAEAAYVKDITDGLVERLQGETVMRRTARPAQREYLTAVVDDVEVRDAAWETA